MKTLNIIASTLVLSTLFFSCNKNESAPIVVDQEFTIEENSQTGTIIGTIDASDPDEGQVVSFEIIDGNDEESFIISEVTGVLRVNNPEKLDYETIQQLTLTLSVSDSHEKDPLETSAKVLINLTDVNEFPPLIDAQVFELDENSAPGFEIGTIVATDEDSYQNLQYSIVESSDSIYFHLDPSTGVLSISDSAAFDYEINKQFSFQTQASDDHLNQKIALATITVNINNVVEITDDAIAYYAFNGNTLDSIGDMAQSTPYDISYVPNRDLMNNRAAFFNGSTSHMDLPSDFDFESRSIGIWFSAHEISYYNRIYNSDHPGLNYGSINMDVFYDSQSDKNYFRMECGGGQGEDLIIEIEKDIWYHAVLTTGPASVKAYLNGQLYDETDMSYHKSVDGNPYVNIGSDRQGTGSFFNGSMDDLIIYDRVLDANEVEMLYQYK